MSSSNSLVLRPCAGPSEWPHLARIWRGAVTATHDFLTEADITYYEERLTTTYLPAVEVTVAEIDGEAVGFSGVADGTLEMLFVDPSRHGHGTGTALLYAAFMHNPELRVDVNEQNPQAVEFYHRRGLVTIGRSPTDGEGRPFPLLHLRAPTTQ
ncbi:GNAT family N-acetyltransferase [Spiractinospora alimapuensis]|uniref:GNAT family N-acetyltransferase n=1 Tax=Spiractinospora alimapuensis TaxID=2820884 RepID=UPI001F30AB6F|nr:GNAT family N-acetyltransferase [Spiractinospora alimapuensis]QVQ54330.1 GNAT family N-acetyltransferase [Spiractinospora alimapuensis]